MAKTKTAKLKQVNTMPSANGKDTPEQLYVDAVTFVEQGQHDDALKKAQKLWGIVKDRSAEEALPALNLLGEISVELGDVDAARGYFERAVSLDPQGLIPEALGGGAEKFLWLAQLCEEGGKQSVGWFERGVKALQHEIATLEKGGLPGFDAESLLVMRMEKKRKLANALCGIVEVYMTDLSWEVDAEARCENLVTEAMTVEDETSPEVLQTLASVRLSQQRKEDAQSALRQSLESWVSLEPEDPAVPDFATRISLTRLLMEAEMEHEAMEVLSRLVQEDDQSVEAWYLGGWCQYLLAEHEKDKSKPQGVKAQGSAASNSTNDQDLERLMKGSRRWLKMAIKLYALLEYEDERLFDHSKELVTALDTVLGPEEEQEGGAEEHSEEEWGGIEDDEEDDDEDEDEEMQDA